MYAVDTAMHGNVKRAKRKRGEILVWTLSQRKVRRQARVSGPVRPAREPDVTEIPSERCRVGDE